MPVPVSDLVSIERSLIRILNPILNDNEGTGRPLKHGAPMLPLTTRATPADSAYILKVGNGSLSDGLRVLIQAHRLAEIRNGESVE